jgi:hypothetical protein
MSGIMPRYPATRQCSSRIAPCQCDPADEWVHGFTIREGAREGIYLAVRRTAGPVRFLDVAVSAGYGAGSVALRVWVNTKQNVVRERVLEPNEVPAHPALALGTWLDSVQVRDLGFDVHEFTTRLVLGDDRLAAHLWDLFDVPTYELSATGA